MEMLQMGRTRTGVQVVMALIFVVLMCQAVLHGGRSQGKRAGARETAANAEELEARHVGRRLDLQEEEARPVGMEMKLPETKVGPLAGLKSKFTPPFRRPSHTPDVLETVDLSAEDGYLWQPMSMSKLACPAGESDCEATMMYCLISIREYQENPWKYPMAAMLQKRSECSNAAKSRAYRLSTLKAYVRDHPNEFLQPSGFVYHETRTGSTLVANMLALVPTNLVVSESSLSEDPARRCNSCSPRQKTQLLRDVLTLMGSTQAGHTHLFFKFQDSTTIGEMTRAFPDVSWVYLFRDPVEVMVSNLKGAYGKRNRFYEEGFDYEAADNSTTTQAIIKPGHKASKPMLSPCLLGGVARGQPKEVVCATRLKALSMSAVDKLNEEKGEDGGASRGSGRGAVVEYTNLPDAVTSFIYPDLFGMGKALLEEHRPYMEKAAQMYSKSMSNPESRFELGSDAHYKHVMSERAYREAANSTGLSALYREMQDMQEWRKQSSG